MLQSYDGDRRRVDAKFLGIATLFVAVINFVTRKWAQAAEINLTVDDREHESFASTDVQRP